MALVSTSWNTLLHDSEAIKLVATAIGQSTWAEGETRDGRERNSDSFKLSII